MRSIGKLFLIAAVVASAANSSVAFAQESPGGSQDVENQLSFPGGEAIVQITAQAPDEVRVGQSYDYQIHVKNISKNVMIHDLVLVQQSPEQFEIQSADIEGAQEQDQRSQQQEQQEQQEGEQKANSSQQPSQTGQTRWTIDRLGPGQTKTIAISAVSDREGEGNLCLVVESYKPALCLRTKFTKPELQITKEAPKSVDICQEIEVAYTVTNSGSGDLTKFTVEDELPEGLETIEGEKHLQFTLEDGLKAGDTRKFIAKLRAERAGNFSSRAMVKGPQGLTAQSNKADIQVQEPKLAVAIEGPAAREVKAVASYTVRVTNVGDAPAPNSQLTLSFPRSADFLQASEPRRSSQSVSQSAEATGVDNEDAKNAGDRDSQNSQQRASEQQSPDPDSMQQAQRSWKLGTLKPGETMEVSFSLRPFESGQLEQRAVAKYVCAVAEERQVASDQATSVTQVIALPGLRVTVIDDQDPAPTGENVTYTIQVTNEGEAPAKDVQVLAKIPSELEFVKATGNTQGEVSEGQIAFKPVAELNPGDSATWKVITKVNQSADVGLTVELNSANFDRKITAEEPTTLFDPQETNVSTQADQNEEQ